MGTGGAVETLCCITCAFSNDDNEIGVVSILCGEGVIKSGDVEATVRKVKCYTITIIFGSR